MKIVFKMKLVVNSFNQKAQLWLGEALVKTYLVSTARNGIGCRAESYCTPTGRLKIAKKIGQGAPKGTVFVDREPNGLVWSSHPDNPLFATHDDLVLSRVMWLSGLDAENSNTLERFIYLQGTNREGLLGTPDSRGSVRFSNDDIIELFDVLDENSQIFIM